jgi:hypothetical protein
VELPQEDNDCEVVDASYLVLEVGPLVQSEQIKAFGYSSAGFIGTSAISSDVAPGCELG